MFLAPGILNKLMKKAYSSEGLTVAVDKEEWIYLAGTRWQVSVKREFIPKKTLGDIIALTGELPEKGERFRATKEGNQMETGLPLTVSEEGFENKDMLTVTDLILFGKEGTAQRLLQDELTGNIYAVNNAFIAIVNNALIDEQNGEHRVERPYFNPITGILWKNNVCKMRAAFRSNDEKNIKIMKNLEGVDITPEIPG